MMPHVSANKGWAPETSRATPVIRGSKVKVGTYHDGFCDSHAMDITEA